MDRKQLILIAAICGGATALGVILPWATGSAGGFGSVSYNGFNTGWGTLVFICALLAGAAMLLIHLGKVGQFVKLTELQHVYAAMGGFAVASLGTLINFFGREFQSQTVMGQEYGVSRGIGLWLCLIAALGGEAVSFLVMQKMQKGGGSATPPSASPPPPKA